MKKCPYCAEEIQDEAIFCKHCKQSLDIKKGEIQQESPSYEIHPKNAPGLVIFGYIFACLSGILGIIIGIILLSSKTVNTKGIQIKKYSTPTRNNGIAIIIVNIIALILWFSFLFT